MKANNSVVIHSDNLEDDSSENSPHDYTNGTPEMVFDLAPEI